VGFSDEVGSADYALIRKTCSEDGTILSPSHPPRPIDRTCKFVHKKGYLFIFPTPASLSFFFLPQMVKMQSSHIAR